MKKLACFAVIFIVLQQLNAQRNVVLIIADDIGTDYFGFYEDHKDTVDVPNIRYLLNRGVRFSNAMSNPVCSSTRAGILTGRYSFRTGVGGIVGGEGGSNPLQTTEVTIPKLLKIYNPAIGKANIGKWHLHQAMPMSNLMNPNVLGYDHYEGSFIGQITSYTNWNKHTNGVASTVTTYATSENVNNAVSWLKTQSSNNPFFMWLAFNAPHAPYHLPPANLHTYTTLTGININANPVPYFEASLQALDTELGRLFDSLQVLNRLDSTDFIFIGDNGNTMQTAQNANPARAKGTVYQYGVHIPFIISGPSVVAPGRVSDALVNTADLFATVLELMGYTNWPSQIPASKPVDSKSIVPIIVNQNNEIRPWSFCEIFKLMPDEADGKAIRNMEYKLIKFATGQEEFYHLSTDPEEINNLIGQSLTPTELSNYNYLCQEMTTLVGMGSFCNPSVGTESAATVSTLLVAQPNPFSSHIYPDPSIAHEELELINQVGRIIYQGKQIATQGFSNLPAGIYFLRIKNNKNMVLKMIKA